MSQTGVGPVDDVKYPLDYSHLLLLKFVSTMGNVTRIRIFPLLSRLQ